MESLSGFDILVAKTPSALFGISTQVRYGVFSTFVTGVARLVLDGSWEQVTFSVGRSSFLRPCLMDEGDTEEENLQLRFPYFEPNPCSGLPCQKVRFKAVLAFALPHRVFLPIGLAFRNIVLCTSKFNW